MHQTFELKRISQSAIPRALEKAERYRLLNEPSQAESICRDILVADPEQQQALIGLALALSDQFAESGGGGAREATQLLARVKDDYQRAYFSGVVAERKARSLLERGPGHMAYVAFREAMAHYERAETLRAAGNDDAVLRWNTCAREINGNPNLAPEEREAPAPE